MEFNNKFNIPPYYDKILYLIINDLTINKNYTNLEVSIINNINLNIPNNILLYNNIIWKSTIPLEEDYTELLNKYLIKSQLDSIRAERNILLSESDKYTSIPDWPHQTEEIKQAWIIYRQELRDLPNNSQLELDQNGNLINVEWPVPPTT